MRQRPSLARLTPFAVLSLCVGILSGFTSPAHAGTLTEPPDTVDAPHAPHVLDGANALVAPGYVGQVSPAPVVPAAPPPRAAAEADVQTHTASSTTPVVVIQQPAQTPAPHSGRTWLWHAVPPILGTPRSNFVEAKLTAGGTIIASKPSYSIYQAGMGLRAGHFFGHHIFVATDFELGGGAGSAGGTNRLQMNLGAAFGLHLQPLQSLHLMPSVGLGWNLWYATGGVPARWTKNALQMDLRMSVLAPITARLRLVLAPYLQPNLVHGGSGPREGAHVTLGLAAGILGVL